MDFVRRETFQNFALCNSSSLRGVTLNTVEMMTLLSEAGRVGITLRKFHVNFVIDRVTSFGRLRLDLLGIYVSNLCKNSGKINVYSRDNTVRKTSRRVPDAEMTYCVRRIVEAGYPTGVSRYISGVGNLGVDTPLVAMSVKKFFPDSAVLWLYDHKENLMVSGYRTKILGVLAKNRPEVFKSLVRGKNTTGFRRASDAAFGYVLESGNVDLLKFLMNLRDYSKRVVDLDKNGRIVFSSGKKSVLIRSSGMQRVLRKHFQKIAKSVARSKGVPEDLHGHIADFVARRPSPPAESRTRGVIRRRDSPGPSWLSGGPSGGSSGDEGNRRTYRRRRR